MAEIRKEIFVCRPYTPKELRDLYGISYKTFVRWIEPFKDQLGPPVGKVYNEKQVALIVEKVGYPSRDLEY